MLTKAASGSLHPLVPTFQALSFGKTGPHCFRHVPVRKGRPLRLRLYGQSESALLDALLNTVSLDATVDMQNAPHVRKSILNFGLADIANRTIDENAVGEIPDEIRAAIVNYEPRIAADTLRIARDQTLDPVELKVRFVISGELVCHPLHVPVEFVADIVEAGKIVVNRL